MPEVSLQSIVGHAHPKALMAAAITSGRIAHAYLFHGEAHIGKLSSARAFAKAALCRGSGPAVSEENSLDSIPWPSCDRCRSCRDVDEGRHPDLETIQPEGTQIKIERIRNLINAIAYKPMVGDRKWILIEDADAMNPAAANSFLKSLEEPPAYTTMILVTSRPDALLPTIRSRCQAVRFGPPSRDEIARWLKEHRGMKAEEADRRAWLSMGRIGLAADTEAVLWTVEGDRVFTRILEFLEGDPSDLLELSEDLASTPDRLFETLDLLELGLRDILILQQAGDASLLVRPDLEEVFETWTKRLHADGLLEILSEIQIFRRARPRNLNPGIVLETLLLHLHDAAVPAPRRAGRPPGIPSRSA